MNTPSLQPDERRRNPNGRSVISRLGALVAFRAIGKNRVSIVAGFCLAVANPYVVLAIGIALSPDLRKTAPWTIAVHPTRSSPDDFDAFHAFTAWWTDYASAFGDPAARTSSYPYEIAWTEQRFGWPFRSSRVFTVTHALSYTESRSEVRGGFEMNRTNSQHLRTIPLSPMWGGFIANWALASSLLFGGHFAMRHVGAARNRRRGCCVKCGYFVRDSQGSECPECGTAIDGS